MSTAAKKFRETVKGIVLQNLGRVFQFHVTEETLYQFDISLYFALLENPGWFEFWEEDKFYTKDILFPKKHTRAGEVQFKKGAAKVREGERKAASRYKRIDYDNRVKFLQDAVVAAVGIPDDSQIFKGFQEKLEDSEDPRAEVTIRVLEYGEAFGR